MTDYASLKVVDLKKVLKERSLPVSGNKADLVQRLQEADETAAAAAAAAEAPEAEAETEPVPEPKALEPENEQTTDEAPAIEPLLATADAENPPTAESSNVVPAVENRKGKDSETTPEEPVTTAEQQPTTGESDDVTREDQETIQPEVLATNDSFDRTKDIDPDVPLAHTDTMDASMTDAVDARIEENAIDATIKAADATIEDVATQERSSPDSQTATSREMSVRRKRSRTPAPDDDEVNKKLKMAERELKVTLPEDSGEMPQDADSAKVPVGSRADSGDVPASATDALVEIGAFENEESKSIDRGNDNVNRAKESHPDSRVGPPNHPPTRTLYIRNLQRPLRPAELRRHLTHLAQPKANDEGATQDFWIDQLRTHCFVTFHDVEAATRVRRGLDNKRWPDEKSRKRLSVDFIPDESFARFVKQEEEGPEGALWEVRYSESNQEIRAELIDGKGGFKEPKQEAPRRDDRAKGFKTLDDLFQSTTTKPKLYFLPVSKDLVDSRLGQLAKGKGGGRRRGEARYTFEDGGKLVEDGPDNGLRLDRPRGFVGSLAARPRQLPGRR